MPDREIEILNERLVRITDGMIKAGIAAFFLNDKDYEGNVEEIVVDVWRAMTSVWFDELPPEARPHDRTFVSGKRIVRADSDCWEGTDDE